MGRRVGTCSNWKRWNEDPELPRDPRCKGEDAELVGPYDLCHHCYDVVRREERRDPEKIRIAFVRQCRKELRIINHMCEQVEVDLSERLNEDDAAFIKDTLQEYIDDILKDLSVERDAVGAVSGNTTRDPGSDVARNAGNALNANAGSRPPAVGANRGAAANTNTKKRPLEPTFPQYTRQLCPDPPKPAEKPKPVGANAGDSANANTPKEGDKRVEHNTGDAANSNKGASPKRPAPVELNAGDAGNTHEKLVAGSAVQNPGESADELMRDSVEEEGGGEDDPLVGL